MPEVIFNGPEGRLEGRYQPGTRADSPLALVLHPHPAFGGTMNNRIVFSLYQLFAKRGYSVMRFNFRGVGRSQGEYDRGEGELSDAASALDWLQATYPNASHCWVAGYSFGAWIGMQLLMRRPEIFSFISVSAPAKDYDFTFLAPCPSSGLFVHGADDTAVPIDTVKKLTAKLQQQRDIVIDLESVAGANHYWNTPEHLEAMLGEVGAYVDRRMPAPMAEVAE